MHGRLFCGDCGNRAAERMGKFESKPAPARPSKIYPANTLDLSQADQPKAPKPREAIDRTNSTQASNLSSASNKSMDMRPRNPAGPQSYPVQTTPARPTHMRPQATYAVKEGFDNAGSNGNAQQNPVPASHQKKKRPSFKFKIPNLKIPGHGNMVWMRLATVTAGMLLLVGYVTYLNYPNIAVKVAASRANIGASMPGYVPGGYNFDGPVAYSSGKLTLTFSGRDGTIALTQSNTRWDSESLLDNHVRQQTSKYSTYQENGLTIYTYDNRYAVWVNGGLMYRIETSDYLNPDDIVKMASSL